MATVGSNIQIVNPTQLNGNSGSTIKAWQLAGYNREDDYTNAQQGGFTSSTDYYDALSKGYATNADYQSYLTSYAANTDTGSTTTAETNDASGIDTSYAANTGTEPISTNLTGGLTSNTSYFANGVYTASNVSGSSGTTDEGVITGSAASGTTGDTTTGTAASQVTNNAQSDIDTSYAANTSSSADTTATTETTEDATEDKQMTYAEYLEAIRDSAYQSAKAQQERSIVDANTSYKQNMATYGANAETLASMGLTGSGYSDYINSQAYAQNRSDIQAANATYAQALQDADTSYAANMLDYMNNNNDRYAALLEGANSGTYTASDVESLADTYGLSETQKNALIAAANTYEANKADEDQQTYYTSYATVLSSIDGSTTDEQISAYAKAYDLSDEDIANLTAYRDKVKATAEAEDTEAEQQSYYDSLIASGYDLSTLSTALNTGKITQEQYDTLKSEYQNTTATEYKSNVNGYITNNDGEGLSNYLLQLDTAYANGEVTQEAYQEIYTLTEEYVVSQLIASDFDRDTYRSIVDQIENYYSGGKISEDTYNSLRAEAVEYYLSSYLGVNLSSGAINASNATTKSFGSYLGTGSNNQQDVYVQSIITAAQNGQIENGTLICFNYGAVSTGTCLYVYYNGAFYKTTYTLSSTSGLEKSDLVDDGFTIIHNNTFGSVTSLDDYLNSK